MLFVVNGDVLLAEGRPVVTGHDLRSVRFAAGQASLGASAAPPKQVLILDSFGREVASFTAAVTAFLNPDGTRRHIRAALEAGATRDEVLFVLNQCAAVMSIHSCSLGAPILLEEAKAAGKQPAPKPAAATPVCDKMRAIGQWNTAGDPF